MNSYYAVQVVTGQENKIKELFAKLYCNHVLCENIEVFIPQHLVHRQIKHNYKNIWSPLWPGYIFIKCAEMSDELYYMIKHISGVIRILTSKISREELNCISPGCYCSRLQKRLELTRRILQNKSSCFKVFKHTQKRHKVVGFGYKNPCKELILNIMYPLLN